jgi:threonine/homoserine/homoserine lactone efflux protein
MAQDLLLIVGITMLCMLSPGPDMVLVMRNTLARGRQSGLFTALGVLSGNFVHITYCLLGVGVVVAHSVVAYSVLKFAGAAYLIFLGVTGFRRRARAMTTSRACSTTCSIQRAPCFISVSSRR